VWAVLCGLLFFGERPLGRHWFGVFAAFLATLLLLSSEFTTLAGSPLGTALMLIAAAAWGFGTHLMRRHLIDLPIITLTFWMMALTVLVMLATSLAFEFERWRWPVAQEWLPLAYNIVFAVAFCHVVWSMLARKLPPAASGLSVMLIPVLGVFSSMWLLGEQPSWQDYSALVLILIALSTVLLPARAIETR
jgi:drug/metabolite transporter (DMT)-like permease